MTGKEITKKLIAGVLTYIITLMLFALSLKLFFPLFIGIVAIQWPEWVVIHSGRFISWFIVLCTVGTFINFIIYLMPNKKLRIEQKVTNDA